MSPRELLPLLGAALVTAGALAAVFAIALAHDLADLVRARVAAWTLLVVSLAALAAMALGCGPLPTQLGVSAVTVDADSVRWEHPDGTPWATALTWHTGAMNLWVEHQALRGGFGVTCRAEAGVVHLASLPPAWALGDTIRGTATTFVPGSDSVSAASFWLVTDHDTMRGEAHVAFPTPCGAAEERLPITLVRVR